jgi:hypothetical protein
MTIAHNTRNTKYICFLVIKLAGAGTMLHPRITAQRIG